jgi:UDP-N-acetylmuramyl pentapeptide synthase
MLFDNKNIALLDLTHGGIPLARNIAKRARSVTAIDIYGTVDSNVLSKIENEGINIAQTIDENVDLIVAPIHLNPALIPNCGDCAVITHHRAVGELLLNANIGKIIEITGTTAKTSTATLLADIASRRMSVISHTTRGVEYWQNGVASVVHQGLSIAPGSILQALDYSDGIDPDLYIFEISLGGTGAGDLNIITSLDNEYRIAGGGLTSTAAKKQMIEYAKAGSTLLINASAGHLKPPNGLKMVTFSDTQNKADVYLEKALNDLWTIYCGTYNNRTIRFIPNEMYDPGAYTTAIVCAAAAACILKIDAGTIESALSDFQGIRGRMRLAEWAGRTVVDNSNSGMNISSVGQALQYSRKIASENKNNNSSKIVLILGEEAKQVCEGLDPDDAKNFIETHCNELDDIILVGERMCAIRGNNVHLAADLDSAFKMSEALTNESDIIISCVKCFR